MKLIFEKNVKSEIKKALGKEYDEVTLFFEFLEDNVGKLKVVSNFFTQLNTYKTIELNFDFKYQDLYRIKKITLSEIKLNDVIFDMILTEETYIEAYSHNISSIKINDNGCDYWMDTLIIKYKNKIVKHNEIVFDSSKIIYV